MVEMLSSLASSTSDGYAIHESFKRFHDHSIDSLKEVGIHKHLIYRHLLFKFIKNVCQLCNLFLLKIVNKLDSSPTTNMLSLKSGVYIHKIKIDSVFGTRPLNNPTYKLHFIHSKKVGFMPIFSFKKSQTMLPRALKAS